jgi:hypothetical protein
MEGQPFGENGVVTTFETFDESRSQRNAPFSCSIRDVTGAAQQSLHLARPLFFLDFDECLQFAQMMSIAQGVQHTFYRGRRPTVQISAPRQARPLIINGF